MTKALKYILLLSLIICFSITTVCAKDIVVKGYGASRDEAVRDALRMAVEQAVGLLIDSTTLTQNYVVVKDEIYAKSQGFVRDYAILVQENQGGQVVVTIRAVVDTEPNSKLLTELQRLKLIDIGLGDPRIAVIIPEYHADQRISDLASESAIIKKLIDAGFNRVVDAQMLQGIRYSNEFKYALRGDRQEILSVASKLGADYLIIGEGFSHYVGNLEGSGVLSCRARLEAKIFRADTAEIVAVNSFQAGGVDITEAVASRKALNTVGEKMGEYMVEKLMTLAGKPEKGVQLIVKNIPSFGKVNILEQELRRISGVNNVFVRDYKAGTVIIDLNYTGTARTLATAVEKLTGIGLVVEETSNSAVHASFKY